MSYDHLHAYAGQLFDTAVDAAEASIYDYVTACGNCPRDDSAEWLAARTDDELLAEMRLCYWGLPPSADARDIARAIERVRERLARPDED